jgi:hypothetical protein
MALAATGSAVVATPPAAAEPPAASAIRSASDGVEDPKGPAHRSRSARPWHITPEAHLSAFTNQSGRSNLAVSFGWGLRAGHRWGDWGGYGQVEQNAWFATEFDRQVVAGVVNLAAGGERLFADGFVRTAVALGVSVLTFDTPFDPSGSVGLFFDLRPLGLRWRLSKVLCLVLDPLHVTVAAPVMGSPSLLKILYRTTVGLEVRP